jgi:hypothetical protein
LSKNFVTQMTISSVDCMIRWRYVALHVKHWRLQYFFLPHNKFIFEEFPPKICYTRRHINQPRLLILPSPLPPIYDPIFKKNDEIYNSIQSTSKLVYISTSIFAENVFRYYCQTVFPRNIRYALLYSLSVCVIGIEIVHQLY